MRFLITLLALVLSACGGGGGDIDQPQARSTPLSIAIEGDSLAAAPQSSWPAKLAIDLPANYQSNAVGGKFSAESLAQYDAKFSAGGGVFILVVGTNDVYKKDIAQTFANIRAIWAKARGSGYKVIASTMITERDLGIPQDPEWSPYRAQLSAMIRAASSEYDALIEFDKLLPDPNNRDDYAPDWHFGAAGNAKVEAAMMEAIRRLTHS